MVRGAPVEATANCPSLSALCPAPALISLDIHHDRFNTFSYTRSPPTYLRWLPLRLVANTGKVTMRLPHFVASAAVALLVVSTHSYAEPRPAAPQVTIGADLKLLRFDWEPVAGATFYRLWIKPGGSPIHRSGKTYSRLDHPHRTCHCSSACRTGCARATSSLPPRQWRLLVSLGGTQSAQPGARYHRVFEGIEYGSIRFFRSRRGVSDDGRTLAVSAQHESSSATVVNGDQADNSSLYSGAVYIFRRSDAGWRQDAYLKSPRPGIQYFGIGEPMNQRAIALAAMALSPRSPRPGKTWQGSGPRASVRFPSRRRPLSPAATLRAPSLVADFFGFSVDMSLDGSTIKVELAASGHHRGPS